MLDWSALRTAILSEKSDSVLPPTIKLPMLPKALLEFTDRARDPDADSDELSRIVANDAGLSSDLLRLANSSAAGARSRVTSVKQALVHLGVQNIQMYLTTSGIKQAMKSSSSKMINFQNFWNTNLERALFARELATMIGADSTVAFTGGMLQDFLLPVITNQLLDHYLEFTNNLDQYANLAVFEQAKLGWNHALAAGQLMFAWNFPDELICCVCLHHGGIGLLKDAQLGKTSVAAVAISALIPDAIRQEPNGMQTLLTLSDQWDSFDLLTVAEKIDDEFQSVATDVKNHFSFLRVCQKALERAEVQ